MEMKANIHVGIEADQCVAAVGRGFAFGSRQVVALASAVLTVVLGFWLNLPQPAPAPVAEKAADTGGNRGRKLNSSRTTAPSRF
jgi:hypothetical protein